MNEEIFTALYSLSGRAAWSDFLIRFFANHLPWILILFLVWQLLRAVERRLSVRPFALMTAAILGASVLSLLIKTLHYRPRPFVVWSYQVTSLLPHVPDAAFPSAHAAAFFALALAVLVYRRSWGVAYLLSAILISLSRVAAGLHSPLDILGGALLGLATGACLIALFRYNRHHVRS